MSNDHGKRYPGGHAVIEHVQKKGSSKKRRRERSGGSSGAVKEQPTRKQKALNRRDDEVASQERKSSKEAPVKCEVDRKWRNAASSFVGAQVRGLDGSVGIVLKVRDDSMIVFDLYSGRSATYKYPECIKSRKLQIDPKIDVIAQGKRQEKAVRALKSVYSKQSR